MKCFSYLAKRKLVVITLVSLVCAGWTVLGAHNHAAAFSIPGDMTNRLPNNGSPATPYLVVTRPGTNGMDAPASSEWLYIPVSYASSHSNKVTFTVYDACDNTAQDSNPANNVTYFWFDGNEVSNLTTSSPGTWAGFFYSWLFRCDTGNNSTVTATIDTSNPYRIETINNIDYWPMKITAMLNASDTRYYVNRYYIVAPAEVYVTYAQTIGEPTTWSEYTGIAYPDSAAGWGWSTRANFAYFCNVSDSTPRTIYFYDTDYHNSEVIDPYWQTPNHEMMYTVEKYNRYTGIFSGYATENGTPNPIINYKLHGGNSLPGDFASGKDATVPFSIDKDYIYSIVVVDINYVNSIQIGIPWPATQVNALDRCTNYQPHLSCTLSPDGQEVGIPYSMGSNVTITNSGGSSASGSITVSIPSGGTTTGSFSIPGGNTINGGSVTGLTANIAVPAGAGVYTATGTLSSSSSAVDSPCTAQVTRTSYPYLRTYGADVWAGGGFGSTCTPAQAHVYAYSSGTGTTALGSSAQFGVAAVLNVNGFYSSSLRTLAGTNIPVNGTTFSNNAGDATYGGAYGAGTCMTDYYATSASSPLGDKGMFSGAFSGTGKQRFSSSAGTIGNITVPKGVQAVVYANGDVTINGNITYDTAVRTSTSDIPYFILVAKGNVRVSPSVTRLDGLYIAQPTDNSATNGKFYTCYPSGGPTQANLDSSCNSQLVVNGAVIAKEVKFFRTNNTVRNSTAGEQPSDFGTGAGTNAAEVINFSPEMYMAPSPMSDPSSIYGPNGTGKYNAIYSLPPVF